MGVHHAPGVVVVQMADDHEIDAVRIFAHGLKGDGGVATLDALDLAILVPHPFAGSGLDENAFAADLDKQEVQPA